MIAWTGGHIVPLIPGGTYADWCDRCMTSSVVKIRFYLWCTDGPRFAGLWRGCQVCEPEKFGEDESPDGDEGAMV